MPDVAPLIVSLGLRDGLSSGLGRVSGQLNQLHGNLGRVGKGIGQVGTGIDRILTRGALAAGAALAGVVTTAVQFEDAFAGVRKTVDATDTELDSLRQTFKDMTREIPLSFEELSRIGEAAGALGIKTQDIEEFTRTVALLGVTTDVSSDQAATSLGQLANVLGLTADDFDNFGATLVDLGNKGASTESQILELAARAGAGAHLIGIANDATLGWSSAVANLGIEVEAGGTALQKFFLESLRNIQDDDTLQVMADTAGVTGAAFKKAFEVDASGALTEFLTGLGKLSQAEQLAVLDALGFSDQRITRTLLGLAGNVDNLTTSLDTSSTAWRENTALTTEAAKRFETTQSQLILLKNNVRSAADTIGSELLPIINELASEFVGFLNQPGTQTAIKQFAKDLAGGVRGLITELKGTDWSGLIDGMKVAADVARGAFDLFNKLPPDIKALAIGALVVNKATGGAVGSIAKGLTNILAGSLGGVGGLLGRGSSPANALWVQSVGGIGGGLPVAGGFSSLLLLGPFIAAGITGGLLGAAAAEAAPAPFGGTKLRSEEGAEAMRNNTSALDDNTTALTNLGQFDPKNFGGTPFTKGIFGDQKAGVTKLPDTAMSPGGTTIKLPDTAMSNLATTATATEKLPSILTRQEIASQTLNAKLAATVPKLMQPTQRATVDPGLSKNIVGAIHNSILASNAWSTRELAAFAQVTAAQRTTAGKTGEVAQRVNEARGAIGRGFGDLGDAQRQLAARVSEARNAINAASNASNSKLATLAAHVAGTSAAVRESGGTLRRIEARPPGSVTVNVLNQVNLNASLIQEKLLQIRKSLGGSL